MSQVTEVQVLDKLRSVKDPELHRDIVSLNMVKSVTIADHTVRLLLELTTPACPMKDQIQTDVDRALKSLAGVQSVEIEWSAQVRSIAPEEGAVRSESIRKWEAANPLLYPLKYQRSARSNRPVSPV